MTTKELIKKYGEGKGESTMWKSVDLISEMLDEKLTPAEMDSFEKKMYTMMQGPHFDEYFAHKQMEHIYYTDEKGVKHQAPYWTDDDVKQVYAAYKNKLKGDVTFWDFYVALNNTKADNCVLYRSWWPDADTSTMTQKIAEATVNWINDEDNPLGEGRVWNYFNKE